MKNMLRFFSISCFLLLFISCVGGGKNTIPIEALQTNSISGVKKALESGADINAPYRSYDNLTPLGVTINEHNFELAKFLIKNGAEINTPGASVMFVACGQTNSVDMVAFLLEHGAEIDGRNFTGSTPLMSAVTLSEYQNPEPLIALLIQKGASVNARDNQGWTPLMHAASQHEEVSLKIMNLLIESGVDIGARNKDNQTALDVAIDHGPPKNAAFLSKKAAEINKKN